MKILIIEDDDILGRVLKEKFEKENFSVNLVVSGNAVISSANKNKPDIILLDIILSKKDGITVLRELKADSNLKNIPVIIISNLGDDEKIKESLKIGAKDYFIKTQHSINEIVEKVNKYLI